ncbi:MAG TPA: hypothetical protein VFW84_06970 [Aquabacterium sp.]|uniref:hypothetical protein n=1 Tax=Aquabacterium sp. TaxID=1872578 RepID=UPI002E37B6EA|nr:hypothetical protein [Aquabacterium sp.]HEX5372461.1 hypothetical protein [Aquabacterium sp.]
MTIRKMTLVSAALVAFMGWGVSAQAQKLTGVTVEPAKAEVGQTVKATSSFEVSNGAINCKVRVNWGDGKSRDFHINQEKDVPLVLDHSYAKPGKYDVRVEGKGGIKCMGADQHATVEVVAKGAKTTGKAAAAASAASATASVCPTGWKLTKAGVSKKTGAFTCTAKANTPIPEPKVACPGDLTYFDNVKKGQLGCRP